MQSQKAAFRKLESVYHRGLNACAIELGKKYVAAYPDDLAASLIYAITLRELARYTEAAKILRRLLKRTEKRWLHLVYAQMGLLYDYKGELAKAEQWFRKSVAARPADATHHIFLGSVLARKGQLEEAIKCHRRATKCSTGAIDEAWFNLGLILRAQEKYQEALKCFHKALEIDPHYQAVKDKIKDLEMVLKLRQQA